MGCGFFLDVQSSKPFITGAAAASRDAAKRSTTSLPSLVSGDAPFWERGALAGGFAELALWKMKPKEWRKNWELPGHSRDWAEMGFRRWQNLFQDEAGVGAT